MEVGPMTRVARLEQELDATRRAFKELTHTAEGLLGDRERAKQSDYWRIRCDALEARVTQQAAIIIQLESRIKSLSDQVYRLKHG